MTKYTALFLLLFVTLLSAQTKLQKSIDQLINKLPEGSTASVFIYDPMADDTLYKKNVNETLIPASNIKLFTTTVILNYLGDNFEFKTQFLTNDPELSDSIINGDLFIRGAGDPSLNTGTIDSLVAEIRKTGLKKITGNIIVDESVFDSIYTRDDWITDEHANVVLPPISGLLVNRSAIVSQLIRKRASNSIPEYKVNPDFDFIKVSVDSKVKNKRRNFESELWEKDNSIEINLHYNNNKKFRRKYFVNYVKSPDLFFGLVVKSELQLKGIDVGGKVIKGKVTPDLLKVIDISTPIENVLHFTNKDSNNFYAECLFKLLGWNYSGESGNSFYATQAIMSYLRNIDIQTEGLDIVDGSGISRFNKVSTSAIVSLLTHTYFDEAIFPVFYNTLSIAGIDGTLKDRFSSPKIGSHFRGKTGTLNGVCSLSGYLSTDDNRDLIISILMEFNRNGANYYRQIQDEIVELLIGK
jgi:serine-type D-Ala-D-Ala carboxypeptidase/endopeptidase (penicillin-binding protein 4)